MLTLTQMPTAERDKTRVAVVLSLVWLPIGLVYGAWATALLWNWFVSPLLGVTTLTMVQALGLELFLQAARYRYDPDVSGPDKVRYLLRRIFSNMATLAIIVAIGWVVHNATR